MSRSELKSRDERLQHAIRVYNELARLRKQARLAPRNERAPLEARAVELGAELRAIMDARDQASV